MSSTGLPRIRSFSLPRNLWSLSLGLLLLAAMPRGAKAQRAAVRLVVRTRTPKPGSPTSPAPTMGGVASFGPRGLTSTGTFPPLESVSIASSPGDQGFCDVYPGAPLKVLKHKGRYSLVRPADASPPIQGWIQTDALGLRVLRKASLFAGPGGRAIGRIRGGTLVRTIRRAGRFMLVEGNGKAHALVWVRLKDLGTGRAVDSSGLRYMGGPRRILKPGPVLAAPGGARITKVIYPSEVRILGKKKVRGREWVHVTLGMPWHIQLKGWVLSKQLRYGFGGPSFGSWYVPAPPSPPRYSGRYVLLGQVYAFASRDDAYASILLPQGARVDIRQDSDPNWRRIQVYGAGLRCRLLVPSSEDIWITKRSPPGRPIR